MTIHITPNNPQYRVIEIFENLRGGNWNTGMPAAFIRLGGCNLMCSWCDTDYLKSDMISLSDILGRLKTYTARNIIITGGGPVVQPHLDILFNTLKAEGYFLCIEASGLNPAPPQIGYVTTSPRACHAAKCEKSCIEKVDEVCIVADGEVIAFCQEMERKIRARHCYLSPCEQGDAMNIYNIIRQIGVLDSRADAPVHWQLNVQMHKWAEIE